MMYHHLFMLLVSALFVVSRAAVCPFDPLCDNSVGVFTMDVGTTAFRLPYVDTQFSPSPLYRCDGPTGSTDCNYRSSGPGRTLFVQDPTIEGDRRNNFVVDLRNTSCSAEAFRLGLSYSSTVLPTSFPVLRVRDGAGNLLAEETIRLISSETFIGGVALFRGGQGSNARLFEIVQNEFVTSATRFAADNLEFCCGGALCYDPCFPGGVTLASDPSRCLCYPGFGGPNSTPVGWRVIADNCNSNCAPEDCVLIPPGTGAPADGACGPCVSGTSGPWQNPFNGVCYDVDTPTGGLTNNDGVEDYPGEPSCDACEAHNGTPPMPPMPVPVPVPMPKPDH